MSEVCTYYILVGYPTYIQLIFLLTISIDIEYNQRKNWIVSQYSKSFLFTQLVVRVDPHAEHVTLQHLIILDWLF